MDESTDRQQNFVLNVMEHTINLHEPSLSILLPSKKLDKCTDEVIIKEVQRTTVKF